jgi:hypothetical protein
MNVESSVKGSEGRQEGCVGAGGNNDSLMWCPDPNSISDHHLTKLREQVRSQSYNICTYNYLQRRR